MSTEIHPLSKHLPKGYPRGIDELVGWELGALEAVAERPCRSERRAPIKDGEPYWAAAQTVSKMESIVRRDIEKSDRGAFLPTFARHWKVDNRQYSKECPLLTGYVFFLTTGDDWDGVPDIHGVYRVLSGPAAAEQELQTAMRVSEKEMMRIVLGTALNYHTRIDPPRYTKYYRGDRHEKRKTSRKPRPSKRARSINSP